METPNISLRVFLQRLQRDLRSLENSPPQEILSLLPVESTDCEHWEAKIQGPVDTPYENGVFVVHIHITRTPNHRGQLFPVVPPKFKFKTKVFHPNISTKGEICLDILGEKHSPAFSLETMLLSIFVLLSDPNTDDFLEPEAAYLYKENREEYDRIAREWTQKYAIEAVDAAEPQENINEVSSLNYS